MTVNSIYLPYVADAITAITGDNDYDAVADRAAQLLKHRSEVKDAAARYMQGDLPEWSFQHIVRDHLGK